MRNSKNFLHYNDIIFFVLCLWIILNLCGIFLTYDVISLFFLFALYFLLNIFFSCGRQSAAPLRRFKMSLTRDYFKLVSHFSDIWCYFSIFFCLLYIFDLIYFFSCGRQSAAPLRRFKMSLTRAAQQWRRSRVFMSSTKSWLLKLITMFKSCSLWLKGCLG